MARRTREAIPLCEAAGYDLVVVETVGVGQSEVAVDGLTDLFVLLVLPGGGDELQGIKRGIVELADLVLVNKADGELKSTATRTAADYAGALRLMRKREGDPEGFPKVMTVSALEEAGLQEVWVEIEALARYRRETGFWAARRAEQARGWFEDEVRQGLLRRLVADAEAEAAVARLADAVAEGARSPGAAAAEVLDRLTAKDG